MCRWSVRDHMEVRMIELNRATTASFEADSNAASLRFARMSSPSPMVI